MYTRFKYTLFLKRSLIMKIAFIIEENLTVYDEHVKAFAKRHDEIIVNRAAAINQSSREHLRAIGYEISEFSTDAQSLGDGLNVEILDGVDKVIFIHYGQSQSMHELIEYALRREIPHEVMLLAPIIRIH